MVRLHLVGFTTDLKNLIFAEERGSTTGGYVVSVDDRLRNTLVEVARLDDDAPEPLDEDVEVIEEAEPEEPPRPKVVSKLTPKEIQSLLRQGKSEEQVARLAETEVDWIRRFSFAILAERREVIEAVKSATLAKPRLGPSAVTIGEAVEENMAAKRLKLTPQDIENSWRAMRKQDRWQVSFEYESRGQKRIARYSFDPGTRLVEHLNDIALELGWRADMRARPASRPAGSATPAKGTPTPRPAPARAPGTAKPAGSRPATSRSTAARQGGQDRPAAPARTGPKPGAPSSRRSALAARSREAASERSEEPGVPRRRLVPPPTEAPAQDAAPPSVPDDDPDATSDEFIIQRPRNPERTGYSSLPTVWRPGRRS